MILEVQCSNIPSFKPVRFSAGLNLIVAEKTEGSSDKDTRNGVGKTLLLDIIHFCLGANWEKEGQLSRLLDRQAAFSIKILVGDREVWVHRSVERPGVMRLVGMPDEWFSGHKVERTLLDDGVTMKPEVFTGLMGERWYGLREMEIQKYAPSFRMLLAFAIRHGKGAFADPFETHSQMPAWQKQVANAFLLSLGWEYAVRWQEWKDKSERYTQARKAVDSGLIPGFSTIGDLESELAKLRRQHERTATELSNFRVVAEYEDIKRSANKLSRDMQERQNASVADGELLRMYEADLEVEEDTEPENLVKLFHEAGVVLGDVVKVQLDDVRQFHHELVVNRRRFLESEMSTIRRRIQERENANQADDSRKSELMAVLQTAGALEEFTKLQNLNSELVGKIKTIEERIESLLKLDALKGQVDEERVELERNTKNDHIDRAPIRQEALGVFDEFVRALYGCSGDLVINVEKTGFKFDSKVDRDDAEGIGKMKVFCYDLLLTRLWSSQAESPRVLAHDTTLFDGVEERQKGHALELAHKESRARNFQYISFWNSDSLPSAGYLGELKLEDHIKLTLDDTPEGSLMGFRF